MRSSRRNDFLLTGLIRCVPCDAAMTSSLAKAARKVYRYYRCINDLHGRDCVTGLLPADPVESSVIDPLRDTALWRRLGAHSRSPLAAE